MSPGRWPQVGLETWSRGSSRGQSDDEFTRSSRLSWAKLIRRVYEVDPLLCPFCGAEMRILAFILDFATAKAIRESLELPAQEPEPLAHAPPETLWSSLQNPPEPTVPGPAARPRDRCICWGLHLVDD
jgi:hypothetical protein